MTDTTLLEKLAKTLERPGAFLLVHPDTLECLHGMFKAPEGVSVDWSGIKDLRVYTSIMVENGTLYAIDPNGTGPQLDITSPWCEAKEIDISEWTSD